MSFRLSQDHEALRAVVREFAENEIVPNAAEWDRKHHFPVDVVHKMGDLGLMGAIFEEEYGGGGGDVTSLCVAVRSARMEGVLGTPGPFQNSFSCQYS